jgi:hypothetical protein
VVECLYNLLCQSHVVVTRQCRMLGSKRRQLECRQIIFRLNYWKRDAYLLPRRVEHICPPVGCNLYECADSTFRRLKFCNFPGVNSTQSLNSWSRGAWNLERHLRSLSSSLQVGPSWINLAITTVSRDLRTMWLPRLRLVQRVGPPS